MAGKASPVDRILGGDTPLECKSVMSQIERQPEAWKPTVRDPIPAETLAAQVESGRSDGLLVLQRMNYFWLLVIIAILIGGVADASSHDPTLLRSWRGAAMLGLSVAFAGWYLLIVLGSRARQRIGLSNWPRGSVRAECAGAYGWLGMGFLLAGLLLALDQSFLGLTYALMGSSLFMPGKWRWLPFGTAVMMSAWVQGIVPPLGHGRSWADMAGGLFNISTSAGIIFVLSRLIHARYKRERLLLELSEANRQLRLAALREADLATLRERNRLAREMHDSLGHALVSIAVKLEAVRLLYSVDAARADTELGETTHLVRATMTDLRRSLAGLGPAALEEQPLCHALAELAREMGRRTGVQTTYSIDEDVALLDRGIQETLYRVGQEALTNIAKHAQAQHIMLRLDVRNGMALLEVGDDGVGLGAAPHSGSLRFGVRGMRERVEALGGTLTLGPRTEGGTVVRARIPAPVSI